MEAAAGWLVRELHAERERWPLWLPAGLGLGIAGYFALPVEPPLWVGALGLGAALVAGWLARRRAAPALAAIALITVLAGFTAAELRTLLVAAPVLEKRLGPIQVSGQVLTVEPRAAGGRVVLRQVGLPGLAPEAVPARVRVRLARYDDRELSPGQWIRVRAILRPPPGPSIPRAFDFARQAYFQQLGAVGYAVGRVVLVAPWGPEAADAGSAPSSSWQLWWSKQRSFVARRVLASLDGDTGAVAVALMTGQRGAISESVLEAMRISGLAHLLAISGLHMGLVAGLLFLGLRACLALSPRLALGYPIKKWAAVAAALGAFGYLFLVGATVPTQRAFFMIGLVLLATLMDRNPFSLRLVAWAAIAVLLITPESLLSASFQMSFAAVTALVAGYEALALRRFGRWNERGPATKVGLYLGGVALTSVIAILATSSFAVFHFNRLALYGLAANLVAVPLTALWIMPWALIALALLPFGLEELALAPMGWGIDGVLQVARAVAGLPGAVVPVPAMPLAGLGLVCLGGLWLCLWRRPWRLAGLGAIAVGLLSLALVRPPDILASGDGKLMAVRGPDGGLWLSTTARERFVAKTWLRRAGRGQGSGRSWPRQGSGADGRLNCDALGCIYRAEGQVVALVEDGRALADDCLLASVLISLEPVRRDCGAPALVIDRFDLWRDGGHVLWLDAGLVRVERVTDWRGERPWALRRNRRRPPAGERIVTSAAGRQ
jgi:competence protein ComEC